MERHAGSWTRSHLIIVVIILIIMIHPDHNDDDDDDDDDDDHDDDDDDENLQTNQPWTSATNAREPAATLGTIIIISSSISIITTTSMFIVRHQHDHQYPWQVYYTEGSGQGKPMLGKSEMLSLV